ncbi:pentatricopeptide repeat-containing protein At5g39350-like [Phoenix dactylifera]|uniref:Pentatricopeptide repeat-containing protein At5g39350-like n=1 Tax=Phoenix dactylifera TaxID=42345 RepID=A0A8B7CS48_PHODC|nr:pentatricopeptide repeat-containing protein At5g39350-like [Phoenix dactylifera]
MAAYRSLFRSLLPSLLHSKPNYSLLSPKSFFSTLPQNPALNPAPHHPTTQTHTKFLRLLRRCDSIEFLSKLHALLVISGFIEDYLFVGEIIDKYLVFNSPKFAISLFDTTRKPNLSLQNHTIRCFSNHGFYAELLCLYARLQNSCYRCSDNYTFPFVIKACATVSSLRSGKEVHCVVLRTGYGGNLVVKTALLDLYAKMGHMELSKRVFDDMSERDVVSWNALISGYCSNGSGQDAFEALRLMQANGFMPNSSTFVSVIPACTSLGALMWGKLLHGFALKCGAFGDEALVPTLISMYAGFDDLYAARMLFETSSIKDLVVWNAMVSAYGQNGKWDEAFQVFQLMHRTDASPNLVTLVSVLPSCSNLFSIHHGESIHAVGIKLGLADQISVVAALVSMYSRLGDLDSARYIFNAAPENSLLLWNSMISGYLQNGEWSMALDTFRDMQLRGIAPDAISVVSVISGCTLARELHSGRSAHAYSIRNGFGLNTNVTNALLALYADCGQFSVNLKLFDKMQVRNVVSWNTLISGWAKLRNIEASISSFCKMRQEGVQFDVVTLISILTCLYLVEDLARGKSIHVLVIKTGCDEDITLTNALISMYTSCGDIDAGHQLFNRLSFKSIVSWNALMTGYRKQSLFWEVMVLFDEMKINGQKPNSVTLLNILPSCESKLQGKSLHAYALRNFSVLEPALLTSTMCMYARFDNVNYCKILFEMVDKGNVVAWNALMSVYIQSKHVEEAVNSFQEMLRTEIEPDSVTMLTLISACAQLESLDLAQCVMGLTIHKGFEKNTSVSNSLIDMFGRCGSISTARELFDGLKEKDPITWSVMINGYGMHGDGAAALGLFSEMKEAGVEPDDITFISILSACSHAGLVEQGRMLFKSMSEEHGVAPRMEHYGCMVDLFGRTGHLVEAYDLVKNLPFKPSASLLESMLGACRCHGNAEIGEAIGKLLIEFSPHSPSSYVMLSNIYAAAGRWADYGRLRWEMEMRGLRKDPGISLIEVK